MLEGYAKGFVALGVLCIAKVAYDVAFAEAPGYDLPVAGVGAGLILTGFALYLEGRASRTP